ncbi:MAG: NAD+ synthase [candidate division Zixibacteria bacterium]|nr:NAD+ synthase [candidate division Zixibacteria bacterium]
MTKWLNTDDAIVTIVQFLVNRLKRSKMSGYVVGLSGGIDSAVAAALAVEAVGEDKVMGLVMPYRGSSESSLTDAETLVRQLRIEHRVIDISPMIDAYYDTIDDNNRFRAGNKMSRERMAILFDAAAETGRLVLGTGNRTEICLGYTTWFGDSACSVNPIGDLYKTEVRLIASALNIPEKITSKAPSADLWTGQTDEDEIGVRYEQIDAILFRIIEEGIGSEDELLKDGFDRDDVSRVVTLINRNWFKRTMPEVASLGRCPIPQQVLNSDAKKT